MGRRKKMLLKNYIIEVNKFPIANGAKTMMYRTNEKINKEN